MCHQLRYSSTLSHIGEIKLHVGRVLLEFLQEFFRWGPHDVMNFNYLVELIITWEQGKEGKDLKQHTANSPKVHFVPIVPISQQALWGSVPPCRDVFSVWLLRIDAAAWPKVCQLDLIVQEQDVLTACVRGEGDRNLRLDVSVEYSVTVHVIYRF